MMKILFYGNCQAQAAMSALTIRNPNVEFEYAGNSFRVTKYDPQRTAALMEWCDHIVTQPVMNTANPDFHEVLREQHRGKITFMPYIWLDGLTSLSEAPGAKAKVAAKQGVLGIVGEGFVAESIDDVGLEKTIANFRKGELDFQHLKRFNSSLKELEAREKHADIYVSPLIRESYQDRPLMLTHNHPHPEVINSIAAQIALRLGLKFSPILSSDYVNYAAIVLPQARTLLSPYVVRDLGLKYEYDLQWTKIGRSMISQIAEALGEVDTKAEKRRAERRVARKLANPQSA